MSLTSAHTAFRRTMTLMAAGNPLPAVLEAIVLSVEAEAADILCSILLLDDTGQRLVLGAGPSLPATYNAAIEGLGIGPRVGSCGSAAFLAERVIVEDIQADPLWTDFKDLAASAGLRACWSQPIVGADGGVLGTFGIYHREPAVPDGEDIAFIEAAAELAAIAIDRQRALENLARSEARARQALEVEKVTARELTTFFEVSLDMLCIRDSAFRFVRVNKAWETTLGHPVAALVGASMLDFIHPDDRVATLGEMERMRRDEEVLGFVNRYRHRDGSYRHLEWRARRVGDLTFGAARDVTERLAFEADLSAATRAAEAANRAKSDFLANMSHEIRTPLNGVIGVVDALARTPLSGEQREMLDLIRNSGMTLERLVSDILDISKIEAGRLEIENRVFDLRAELASVADLTHLRAQEKGLAFRVTYDEAARGEFVGDSTRIKQILGNLLSNAVKFTQAGEIGLSIALAEAAAGGQPSLATIEVADTGLGMDAAAQQRLFQRFSQADATITRQYGGTGLGLAICRSLAELMGGDIAATSEPGRGSVFRVSLPLHRARSLAAYDAEIRRSEGRIPGQRLEALQDAHVRILLAEDHPTNQKVVQLILAPLGVGLSIVENGADAVAALREDLFDLVLMDMQMPVMDGLAAVRAIRDEERQRPERRRTPIIMLSANAMPEHRHAAQSAGADFHISKPVTAEALIRGVRDALAPPPAPAVLGQG